MLRKCLLLLFVTAKFNELSTSAQQEPDYSKLLVYRNGTEKPKHLQAVHIFKTPLEDLPLHVIFYLNTRHHGAQPVSSRLKDEKLFGGELDIAKNTIILIHGFHSGKDKFFASHLRKAYLELFDYNVVIVDWSAVSHFNYLTARNDVDDVGKLIAKFIDRLCLQTGLPVDRIHLIGHSLGAHVAGVVGRNVQCGKLPRVTGLDPAGPFFSSSNQDLLNSESAHFVDVIHTCGGGLGYYPAMGHVDFYPNGGKARQPGCGLSFGKCSHERAAVYYAESLHSPNEFESTQCESWKSYKAGECEHSPRAMMGAFVSPSARGNYWLRTAKSAPFGLGKDIHSTKSRGWRKYWAIRNTTERKLQSLLGRATSPEKLAKLVFFFLYSREPPSQPIHTRIACDELFEGAMNTTKKTVILVHGFHSGKNELFASHLRKIYVKRLDYNAIIVDWSRVTQYNYASARIDIYNLGMLVAKFIKKLCSQYKIQHNEVHVIGHSLGAHIAGVAGRNVKNEKLFRVTGLDPAGPMFSYSDDDRLNENSATFVDVIHTCGNVVGFFHACGHVDFYPNGAKVMQPGCGFSIGTCCHTRSILYYAESLMYPRGFLATKCDSWKSYKEGYCNENPTTYMGRAVSRKARGAYWLFTADSKPYGFGSPRTRSAHSKRGKKKHHAKQEKRTR